MSGGSGAEDLPDRVSRVAEESLFEGSAAAPAPEAGEPEPAAAAAGAGSGADGDGVDADAGASPQGDAPVDDAGAGASSPQGDAPAGDAGGGGGGATEEPGAGGEAPGTGGDVSASAAAAAELARVRGIPRRERSRERGGAAPAPPAPPADRGALHFVPTVRVCASARGVRGARALGASTLPPPPLPRASRRAAAPSACAPFRRASARAGAR